MTPVDRLTGMLDRRRFEQPNDTLGHAAGDGLLRCISATLTGVLRSHDVAGLGHDGSDFDSLYRHADTALYAEQAIRRAARAPLPVPDRPPSPDTAPIRETAS
jgi:predicted signal transduction protein with EAL and GGDEF domain